MYIFFSVFLVRSNSAADMLDTAGPAAAAASTGAKKATLQKLMSFDMMEPGYPMDEEMMLEDEEEDEDLVFNEDYLEGITSCNKVSVTSVNSSLIHGKEIDSGLYKCKVLDLGFQQGLSGGHHLMQQG